MSSVLTRNCQQMAILEVCVENLESYRNAVVGGAGRIELCSALSLGGLTPSLGLFQVIKRHVGEEKIAVPIFVMIRPREGDFVYDDDELSVMEEDIRRFKEAGADGFVFGVLTADGRIDEEACRRLLQSAGMCTPCTFHRAFDVLNDPLDSLESIIDLGFRRILTSGQQSTALQGAQLIAELERRASGRIIVMAGAGIDDSNAVNIVQSTSVKEVHGSASRTRPAGSVNTVSMGSGAESAVRRFTCRTKVENIVRSIQTNQNN